MSWVSETRGLPLAPRSSVGGLEIASLGVVVWQVHEHGALQAGRYLRADGLSSLFLINIAFISALVLVYASGYLRHPGEGRFSSPRWFYALVFLFLFTMISVCLSANLGLLWIMMEGTTLASALLVGFYNTKGAVEAGWKYLMVCTVGIAFALFGTIVLYLAAVKAGMNPAAALDWVSLMDAVPRMGFDPHLVKLAFVFVIVGYGTKIGFVPMHSWLPDAHAEAPTPISALLSAVLLNCAMYAVMRYDAIVSHAAGRCFSAHASAHFWLDVDDCRGLAHPGAAQSETPDGLQQHRAHGNHCHRPGTRGAAGTFRRAAAYFQSLGGKVASLLQRRQHPRKLRDAAHG